MKDIDEVFDRLGKSGFRSGFKLKGKELDYLRAKGLPAIMDHAADRFGESEDF